MRVKDKLLKFNNDTELAPEEPRDGDVGPEDPRYANEERHGGDGVRGKGEDDEKQRPHDAHRLQQS